MRGFILALEKHLEGWRSPEVLYMVAEFLEEKYPQISDKTTIEGIRDFTPEIRIPIRESFESQIAYVRGRDKTKGRGWRILGEIFRKDDWVDKGYKNEAIVPLAVQRHERTVQIQRASIGFGGHHVCGIVYGYDPMKDMIFLKII